MSIRIAPLAIATLAAATLAACGSPPRATSSAPSASPSVASTAPASMEMGRVVAIESMPAAQASTTRSPNVLGAVVGGVAGAALGRQVGDGRGRDAATVLGGVAGAAAGSQVGRGNDPAPVASSGNVYRVTVQTDQGLSRQYEVSATGDLRVGDRVRVENGVIYRS
jgi:outer membrane lipoprotein SlyB